MAADLAQTARSAFPVQWRPALKVLLSLGLTAVVFYLVFSRAEVPSFSSLLGNFTLLSFFLIAALLVVGATLSVWRLQLIAWDLGYQIAWRDALAALSIGQLAGSMFFQIVGQLMARGTILARRGMPVAATVTMTVYERAAAASVSLLLAVAGGWYVFGRVTLDTQASGLLFIKIVCGLLMAFGAGAWLAWGDKALQALARQTDRLPLWPILRNIIISSAIQFSTMAAYVVAATTIAPGISLLDLAAASAVVMLAASLPISLAGWGVRELSAVLVLSMVGMSSHAALMVAIAIGTIALGVLCIFALISFWAKTNTVSTAPVQSQSNVDYVALLDWALPILAVTGVFFQLYIPVGQSLLNVNLADPLAILGGSLFVLAYVLYERRWPEWRISWLNAHIIAITATLAVSLVIGAYAVGWTPWATTNRFLGWFILLGFGATASLIVRRGGREGLMMLLRTFAAVACSIVVLDLALNSLIQAGLDLPKIVLAFRMAGFAQNPNAFAFQVLLAICAVIAADFRPRIATFLLSICLLGVWYSASRAAFLALPAIFGLALYMRVISAKRVIVAGLIAVSVVVVIFVMPIAITSPTWMATNVSWLLSFLSWLIFWTLSFLQWLLLIVQWTVTTFTTWIVVKVISVYAAVLDLLPGALRSGPLPEPGPAAPIPTFASPETPATPDFQAIEGPSTRFSPIEQLTMGQTATSNLERIESLEGGLRMFLANPIFGAGLGVYIANRIRDFGAPLVIHSSPLWLLAEMGLIGFAILVAPVVRIFLAELRKIRSADPATHFLLLILVTFGIVSAIHDIMYQRTFWLLLGAGVSYIPIMSAGREPIRKAPVESSTTG